MTSPTATSASQLSICRKQQERQKTVKAIESVNIFGILEKYRDMIENMQRLNADKKSDDTKKISADDLEFGAIRNPEYEILVIKSISSDNQVRRICLGNKH